MNYKFRKFDLVAAVRIRIDSGETISLIGIVDSCDDKTVSLSVVWSKYYTGPYDNHKQAWFVGDTIEFNPKELQPIGDLSFPYDIPGHLPFIFPGGDRKFETLKKAGKIADREQFKELLAYVRIFGKEDIGQAIIDFFDKEGWSDYANTFIQGLHKDGREWKERKGQVPALICI